MCVVTESLDKELEFPITLQLPANTTDADLDASILADECAAPIEASKGGKGGKGNGKGKKGPPARGKSGDLRQLCLLSLNITQVAACTAFS